MLTISNGLQPDDLNLGQDRDWISKIGGST